MNKPGKEKKKQTGSKEPELEPEKDWENPRNPEAPTDPRDVEKLQRQLEEAQRRKENLSEDKT
ncbi:MAG: hypothetical protein ACO1NS_13355 [Daejeonella sp.]